MSIDVQQVSKRFGTFQALDSVDLSVKPGELMALLGPSGSGKTTLLRIIAGLEWPDHGDVLLNGASTAALGARERRIGFVFQHYALFRHMTVFDNVAFGLRVKPRNVRPSVPDIRAKVLRLLDLVQIDGLANRYPAQLSGGQRQRAALARALATEPQVLLLDEPFGALDAQVRKELRRWLRQLHDELRMTSVFVTHDQEEALEVSDRVVVMHQGRVEQVDTPQNVYDHPANPFVFQFLGKVNQLPGTVSGGRARLNGITFNGIDLGGIRDGNVSLFVRPHEITLQPGDGHSVVRFLSAVGPTVRLDVEVLPGLPLVEVELSRQVHDHLGLRVGSQVGVHVAKARVFPA